MEEKFISKEIYSGILVHRKLRQDNAQEFHIENQRFNNLDFHIDFSETEEVQLQGHEASSISSEIPSKTTFHIVTVRGRGEIKAKFKFALKPPPIELARIVIREEEKEINKKLKSISRELELLSINTCSISYIFEKIRGSNFVNPYFPPNDFSVYSGASVTSENVIHWRRPVDFFEDGFEVIPMDIDLYDIRPGQLGDAWFYSAMATLAERPELIRRLFLTPEVTEAGIYRVRFCKGGEWVIVTVDDYFPCYPQLAPMFSRTSGKELWLLILEKAYAALHSSYYLLTGGYALEALIDLTGCPTVVYDLAIPEDEEAPNRRDELWAVLQQSDNEGALVSLSTPGEKRFSLDETEILAGLLPGHSYTVIQIKEAYGHRVLNIRNPWSAFDWTGDWSNQSALWNGEMVRALDPELHEDDGTFWMAFNDIPAHFQTVNICRASSYYEARLRGKFVRFNLQQRSTVASKWYYCFDITTPTKLFIAVHQEDERFPFVYIKRPYLDIGIVILKRGEGDVPEVYDYKKSVVDRQVEWEIELDEGSYIILPRTSGCKLSRPPDAPQEYITLMNDGMLSPIVESTIRDIFKKFDVTVSDSLTYHEFKALVETLDGTLSASEFEKMRKTYAFTQNGLTLEGLFKYFREAISKGEEKVWGWFNKLGYDNDLFSVKSKPFMLTIHSATLLKVSVKDAIGTSIDKLATLELLRKYGTKKNNHAEADLMVLKESLAGLLTFGLFNNLSDRAITPWLGLKKLTGTIRSTANDEFHLTLPPKTGEVVVHVLRVDFDYQIKYDFQLNS